VQGGSHEPQVKSLLSRNGRPTIDAGRQRRVDLPVLAQTRYSISCGRARENAKCGVGGDVDAEVSCDTVLTADWLTPADMHCTRTWPCQKLYIPHSSNSMAALQDPWCYKSRKDSIQVKHKQLRGLSTPLRPSSIRRVLYDILQGISAP
jgi:hypothetical protein